MAPAVCTHFGIVPLGKVQTTGLLEPKSYAMRVGTCRLRPLLVALIPLLASVLEPGSFIPIFSNLIRFLPSKRRSRWLKNLSWIFLSLSRSWTAMRCQLSSLATRWTMAGLRIYPWSTPTRRSRHGSKVPDSLIKHSRNGQKTLRFGGDSNTAKPRVCLTLA